VLYEAWPEDPKLLARLIGPRGQRPRAPAWPNRVPPRV